MKAYQEFIENWDTNIMNLNRKKNLVFLRKKIYNQKGMQNVSQMIAINYNNCLRINLIESLNFQIVLKDDETFAVGKIENWLNE